MYHQWISNIKPLGFHWDTPNPFVFCAHHRDFYPKGNDELGPAATLKGRFLGQDFTIKDGWRMYHGERVPGFPEHPHRGFETVTITLKGFVDHSDSHSAAGRYGNGDVQWMTAGSGLQHAEMFPLLDKQNPNSLELFQLWLNLPKDKKFCNPHYAMLWSEDIPILHMKDERGNKTDVTVIAGKLNDTEPLDPAPDSWAFDPGHDVAIWLIRMDEKAQWTLPAASPESNRTLYFYQGKNMKVGGVDVPSYHSVDLLAEHGVVLENGEGESFLLLLQGKPINEPIVQHGPFVMNSREEINQAIIDYQRTRFGGWPWPSPDHVHDPNKGRFAKYADGKIEEK